MKLYRVRNWDKHFENNRTKEIKNLAWVPFPNKQDGDGYTELLDSHPDGDRHYGAWCALVQIASKCDPRGTLLRDTGKPHSAESLARMSRFRVDIMATALERLVSIGWLEVCENPAPSCGDTAPSCGLPEQNRTEQNRTHSEAAPGVVPNSEVSEKIEQETVYTRHPLLAQIHKIPMLRAITLEIWLKCVQRRHKHLDWSAAVKWVCDKAELQTDIQKPGAFLDTYLSIYEKDHLANCESRRQAAELRAKDLQAYREYRTEMAGMPERVAEMRADMLKQYGKAFVVEAES
ncbi:hypothetical protein CCP3SC15_6010001 [Gammaproteobacteria bacterium]